MILLVFCFYKWQTKPLQGPDILLGRPRGDCIVLGNKGWVENQNKF